MVETKQQQTGTRFSAEKPDDLWVCIYTCEPDAWGTSTRGDPRPSSTYCLCSRLKGYELWVGIN